MLLLIIIDKEVQMSLEDRVNTMVENNGMKLFTSLTTDDQYSIYLEDKFIFEGSLLDTAKFLNGLRRFDETNSSS